MPNHNTIDPTLLLITILALAAVVVQLYSLIIGIKRRTVTRLETQLKNCEEQHGVVSNVIADLRKQVDRLEGRTTGIRDLASELLVLAQTYNKCPACKALEKTDEPQPGI